MGESLEKEIQALKEQLEKSQGAHEKQVHHMDGEINRQINKVASAEKERDGLRYSLSIEGRTCSHYRKTCDELKEELRGKDFAFGEQSEQFGDKVRECDSLKEQIAKSEVDTANERTEATVFETMHDNQVKELDVANEKLARMGEALKKSNWMLDATPLDMRTVEDEELCFNENKNALSSYDPKWIAGVRAEAQLEVWEEVERQRDKLIPQAFKVFLDTRIAEYRHEASSQPNQSREKRG